MFRYINWYWSLNVPNWLRLSQHRSRYMIYCAVGYLVISSPCVFCIGLHLNTKLVAHLVTKHLFDRAHAIARSKWVFRYGKVNKTTCSNKWSLWTKLVPFHLWHVLATVALQLAKTDDIPFWHRALIKPERKSNQRKYITELRILPGMLFFALFLACVQHFGQFPCSLF